jgi:hypothetical protein
MLTGAASKLARQLSLRSHFTFRPQSVVLDILTHGISVEVGGWRAVLEIGDRAVAILLHVPRTNTPSVS